MKLTCCRYTAYTICLNHAGTTSRSSLQATISTCRGLTCSVDVQAFLSFDNLGQRQGLGMNYEAVRQTRAFFALSLVCIEKNPNLPQKDHE